jgi:hypothetical protein
MVIQLTATNGAHWSEFKYDVYGIPEYIIPEPGMVVLLVLVVGVGLKGVWLQGT